MEEMVKVNVLTIKYDGQISQKDISCFRGAVIASMGSNVDMLFHNHYGDKDYKYSYPLVQYKRMGRNACVVLVNDAIKSAGPLLSSMSSVFQIGHRCVEMTIEKVLTETCKIEMSENLTSYKLRNWLPLNADNYKRYRQMSGMIEQLELLQGILVGNIISMFKGVGITLTEDVKVFINSLSSPRPIEHKGVKLIAFDVEFTSNVSLPNHIGLGKNASLGYGVIEKLHLTK